MHQNSSTNSTFWLCASLLWLAVAAAMLLFLPGVDAWSQNALVDFPKDWRSFFRSFTDVGKSDWMLVTTAVVGIILYVLANRIDDASFRAMPLLYVQRAVFLFVSVAGAGLTTMVIKQFVGRARPKFFAQEGPSSFNPFTFDASYASFPSGHSTNVVAFATALTLLWPRLGWVLLPCAGIVAITRVLVGAHYPTDVIGGALLAVLFVLAIRQLFASRNYAFTQNGDKKIIAKQQL